MPEAEGKAALTAHKAIPVCHRQRTSPVRSVRSALRHQRTLDAGWHLACPAINRFIFIAG